MKDIYVYPDTFVLINKLKVNVDFIGKHALYYSL